MACQDQMLTIPDITNLLKVTENAVYSFAQNGDLPVS